MAAKLANMPRGGNGSNQFSKLANLQNSAVTQTQAAEMLNVSPRNVATAKKVHEEAIPEITKKMDSGELSVAARLRFNRH